MKKTFMMMAVVGCAVGMLTGCGVPQEEHDAAINQLKTESQDAADKLNGKIADLESLLKAEQSKVRRSRVELDNASEQIKSLKKKAADSAKSLAAEKTQTAKLQRALTSAKSMAATAQDDAAEKADKLAEALTEVEELQRRFDQFRENMSALGSMGQPQAAPAAEAAAEPMVKEMTADTPAANEMSALDILNEMSMK